MARPRLNVLFIGNQHSAFKMERIIKKFMPPDSFHVEPVRVDPDHLTLTKQRISKCVSEGASPTKLGSDYEHLQTVGLSLLTLHPSAHLVIGTFTGPTTVGLGTSSHFATRALLMDAMRKASEWRYHHVHPLVAEVIAPYLGPTGATEEQSERNTKTALRNVFEGWRSWSERIGSSVKFLEPA